jgi:TM2 domain-containing membrane protein YozV
MMLLNTKERAGHLTVSPFQIKKNRYKSPFVAALWSIFIPGFGQFYVQDYLTGLVLIAFEVALNLLSHLNLAIYYSFTGEYEKAASVVNMEYGLFYPSVYVYNIWHAYNKAQADNEELEEQGVPKQKSLSKHTGLLYGIGLGMFFGLHYYISDSFALLKSPVFNGILLGLIGGALGLSLELLYTYFSKTMRNSN